MHQGGERSCESEMSCLRTQRNVPCQDQNPDHFGIRKLTHQLDVFCAIFVHSDLLDLTHPSALVLNTTPAVKDPVQSMRQGVYSVW